jgi:uncharacterized phage protein gp47/JayE
MATTPIPLDYVTKDYEGFLQMMKDAIPTLAPEWTNTEDTDQGIAIIRMTALGLHLLAYYQDKSVNEAILELARTRKGVLYGAGFLGYVPFKQKAATVELTITKVASKLEVDITIPAGTKVSTDPKIGNPVIFELDRTLLIPAGDSEATVSATQGQTVPFEALGTGKNLPSETMSLTFPNVLEEGLTVTTGENGVTYPWTLVDSFIDSSAIDRHYITEVLDSGFMKITFGNGISGMKLPFGATVSARYRYGGGIAGNVGTNKLKFFLDTNVSANATVTNAAAATGGAEAESLERIKLMAPRAQRTRDRAVTPTDFEDLASKIVGVQSAKCIETFNANSDVNLYISTPDGTAASTALKNQIIEYIEPRMVMNNTLNILDAAYKEFEIEAEILVKPNFSNDETQALIETMLDAQFVAKNFQYGETVFGSQIIAKIFAIHDGILNVTLIEPETDTIPAANEIPTMIARTITVTGGV